MTILQLLQLAAVSRIGLVVETTDPVALKQKLYAAKRKHPGFAALSFLTSRTNPDTEVWIANAEEARPAAGAEAGDEHQAV